MPYRVLLTAVVATAILASGCSSSKPSIPNPVVSGTKSSTAQASASRSAEETTAAQEPAAGAKLDADACLAVTGANLDLATATNHDDARKAGETFEKYDLPADVKTAVEHFVGTNGAQFDDPDYDKYNKQIDGWVKQVCPLG
ncbi:hypothetical protein [Mycobacterium sp.]|jgi:hypothetical protein|uniref:hypothetical protein n=1 Tax=Mycobacterium sp. TaxID=1785 RepID=UPI0028BC3069|nr:hypothetical protein [Mycobacterium sp.]MDT5052708.1 hypothetical protein [Mycobacterium sp.]